MQTALLIIDVQNDYFPGGAMELVGATEAGESAGRALAAFRERSLPVVHIRHVATRSGASFFLPGTPGVEIHPSVSPLAGETVIAKHHANAFRNTGLLERLQDLEVGRLAIVGMMTHMCIDTSVRAAADLGFECLLGHDACATRAQSFGDVTVGAEAVQVAYLAALDGTFARVLPVDELVAGL